MSVQINMPPVQDPPLPAFELSPVLDNVTYTLRFRWYAADASWRMTVLDEPGQVVLMGLMRLSVDWFPYRSRVVRTPPGAFYVTDTSGAGIDPGISDLGARVQLWYITAAELVNGLS